MNVSFWVLFDSDTRYIFELQNRSGNGTGRYGMRGIHHIDGHATGEGRSW